MIDPTAAADYLIAMATSGLQLEAERGHAASSAMIFAGRWAAATENAEIDHFQRVALAARKYGITAAPYLERLRRLDAVHLPIAALSAADEVIALGAPYLPVLQSH
jgi:hypothetical protein